MIGQKHLNESTLQWSVVDVFQSPLVGGLEHEFFHILGMSSSQLLLTPSFFRGVGLNHQPVLLNHGIFEATGHLEIGRPDVARMTLVFLVSHRDGKNG